MPRKSDEELMKIPLEVILDAITFKSIEVVRQGSGWVGTRYVIHTYNYGSSGTCETFDDLKKWIISNLGYSLRDV